MTFNDQHPEFQHLVRELQCLRLRNLLVLERTIDAPLHLFSFLALAFITLERFLRILLGKRASADATLSTLLQQATGKKAAVFVLSDRDVTISRINTMRLATLHGLIGSIDTPLHQGLLIRFAFDLVDFIDSALSLVNPTTGESFEGELAFVPTTRAHVHDLKVFDSHTDLLAIRHHNLLFGPKDCQDTLLLQAGAASTITMIEALCRSALHEFELTAGNGFRDVLTRAVLGRDKLLTISCDDEGRAVEDVVVIRNALVHANYEQFARELGAPSVEHTFGTQFASIVERLFWVYQSLRRV